MFVHVAQVRCKTRSREARSKTIQEGVPQSIFNKPIHEKCPRKVSVSFSTVISFVRIFYSYVFVGDGVKIISFMVKGSLGEKLPSYEVLKMQ